MKIKKRTLFILTSVFLLSSCMSDVQDLYTNHAYDTGDFMQNFYDVWNDNLKDNINESKKKTYVIDANLNQGFIIENQQDLESNYLFPEDRNNSKGEPYTYIYDTPHEHHGSGYGPSNNLISIEPAFARGFLSRLYDGRLFCDGRTFAQNRVQIDKNGYGTLFPKELVDYKYFAISLRGGEMSSNYNFRVEVNLNVSFYVYDADASKYNPIEFQMLNFPVITNSGGMTTLIGFYFGMVLGTEMNLLKRASAMSITFDLVSHVDDYEIDYTVEASENKIHFALMLYELLLPKSSWH